MYPRVSTYKALGGMELTAPPEGGVVLMFLLYLCINSCSSAPDILCYFLARPDLFTLAA